MVNLTAPGVYIQEVPSGVHTVTGVATSITAFVGRTPFGPMDGTAVSSFAEFVRRYGAPSAKFPLTYAVNDFFLNGGSTAVIVRLANGAHTTTFTLTDGTNHLDVVAVSPGAWANVYKLHLVPSSVDSAAAAAFGVADATHLFDVQVIDTTTNVAAEVIRNVTTDDVPRRIDRALALESALLTVRTLPVTFPHITVTVAADVNADAPPGDDGSPLAVGTLVSDAQKVLDHVDLFNLLVIPPDALGTDTLASVASAAAAYCVTRRAVLIADPKFGTTAATAIADFGSYAIPGLTQRNVAAYFPMQLTRDPVDRKTVEQLPASGAIAGAIAANDAQRGVWKAPAGLDVGLATDGVAPPVTDADNGTLNAAGINCLRAFPNAGTVVWGARTLRGADNLSDDYKYLPVRRLALYLEESLYRGTQWVVFEPNAEPLWAQIRLDVGSFMQSLFRQGAFAGTTPQQAYLVKCDAETTQSDDVNRGIVNIIVGFAPLKPAEFVVIKIEQLAQSAG
jgi:uncharacterized protein